MTYFGSTEIPSSGYWQHDIRFSGTGGEDASGTSLTDEKLERIGYELTAVDNGIEFADTTIDDWSGVYPEDEGGPGDGVDVESAATTVLAASVGVVNPALGLGLSAADVANDLTATDSHGGDGLAMDHYPQSCSWGGINCNKKNLEAISFYQRCYVKSETIVNNPQFEIRVYLDDGFENNGRDYSQEIVVKFETFGSEDDGVDNPVETSSFPDDPAEMSKEQKEHLNIKKIPVDNVENMTSSQEFIAENYADEDDVLYTADVPFNVSSSTDD